MKMLKLRVDAAVDQFGIHPRVRPEAGGLFQPNAAAHGGSEAGLQRRSSVHGNTY
jgi:hypothetical protein